MDNSSEQNLSNLISNAPLDIGGGSVSSAPKAQSPQTPQKTQVAQKPSQIAAMPAERITGVRTFFTKLHEGALNFLDGQITEWLKKNPNIRIKRTNTVVGEIQGKKTEPNILVTVWY